MDIALKSVVPFTAAGHNVSVISLLLRALIKTNGVPWLCKVKQQLRSRLLDATWRMLTVAMLHMP